MKHKIYYLAILALLFSCKKEIKQDNLSFVPVPNEKQDSKVIFSKVLAIALEKEPNLRLFIKNEALKQFDRDNDVLFQMIKDEKITSDQTFYQVISKYAQSKEKLDSAINSLPTLTIMVPELLNFTPDNWKTESEIPQVAVSPENKNFTNIDLYNSKGEITKIPNGSVPNFPVVVVKENERLVVGSNKFGKTVINNKSGIISLADNAFDGSITKINKTLSLNSQLQSSLTPIKTSRIAPDGIAETNPQALDQAIIDAYNKKLDWQRDYVYYGLNPQAGVNRGKFNNDYSEHIISIKLADNNYDKISSHTDDPKATTQYPNVRPGNGITLWTNGKYDIRIAILINSKNGGALQINKIFSLEGKDLFDVKYQLDQNQKYYNIVSITPIECFLYEPIAAWDLDNYGAQWKFIAQEFDPATETTLSYTNTTQYASNFEYDPTFGEKVKLGIKFGQTTTTTNTNSYQVKTTTGSNDLGEGILDFSNPIILRKEKIEYTPSRPPRDGSTPPYYKDVYVTNDVSTGSMYISVEPRKIRK